MAEVTLSAEVLEAIERDVQRYRTMRLEAAKKRALRDGVKEKLNPAAVKRRPFKKNRDARIQAAERLLSGESMDVVGKDYGFAPKSVYFKVYLGSLASECLWPAWEPKMPLVEKLKLAHASGWKKSGAPDEGHDTPRSP